MLLVLVALEMDRQKSSQDLLRVSWPCTILHHLSWLIRHECRLHRNLIWVRMKLSIDPEYLADKAWHSTQLSTSGSFSHLAADSSILGARVAPHVYTKPYSDLYFSSFEFLIFQSWLLLKIEVGAKSRRDSLRSQRQSQIQGIQSRLAYRERTCVRCSMV